VREHVYHISRPGWYCVIRRSYHDESQQCLRIEYMSDQPDSESLQEFMDQEYPELKDKNIIKVYNDGEWLSEYNLGKPKGCFALMIVFFEVESFPFV